MSLLFLYLLLGLYFIILLSLYLFNEGCWFLFIDQTLHGSLQFIVNIQDLLKLFFLNLFLIFLLLMLSFFLNGSLPGILLGLDSISSLLILHIIQLEEILILVLVWAST